MTSPILQGFPDWARQASEAQVIEIQNGGVLVTGPIVFLLRYMGSAVALQCSFSTTAPGAQLKFAFYADSGGFTLIDTYNIECLTADIVRQPVPVKGPYMSVTLTPQGAAAYNYSILVVRTPDLSNFAGVSDDVAVFSKNGVPIGIGATATLDSAIVQEGEANWTGIVTNGPWDIEIIAVDHTGAETILDQTNQASPGFVSRHIYLPPWHIRAKVFNESGMLSLYDIYMTRRHNV